MFLHCRTDVLAEGRGDSQWYPEFQWFSRVLFRQRLTQPEGYKAFSFCASLRFYFPGDTMLQIRRFSIEDKDRVIRLWRDCNLVVPWNDPEKDIQRKLGAGSDLFLVGELDGGLIASVMGGYDGHRGWIYYLAVDPNFRHRGFARKMMAEMENRLIAMGCPKINLLVRNANTEVIDFYRHLGFDIDQSVSLGKRLIPDN